MRSSEPLGASQPVLTPPGRLATDFDLAEYQALVAEAGTTRAGSDLREPALVAGA